MSLESIVTIVAAVVANAMTVYGFQRSERRHRAAQWEELRTAVARIPELVATVGSHERRIGLQERRHERLLGRLEGAKVIESQEEC